MDSGSSSIVELGRFMTGFLAVMGVGMYRQCYEGYNLGIEVLITCYSVTGRTGALRSDPTGSDGYEHCWWAAHIRHDHQLYYVLPPGGGVLSGGDLLDEER